MINLNAKKNDYNIYFIDCFILYIIEYSDLYLQVMYIIIAYYMHYYICHNIFCL